MLYIFLRRYSKFETVEKDQLLKKCNYKLKIATLLTGTRMRQCTAQSFLCVTAQLMNKFIHSTIRYYFFRFAGRSLHTKATLHFCARVTIFAPVGAELLANDFAIFHLYHPVGVGCKFRVVSYYKQCLMKLIR